MYQIDRLRLFGLRTGARRAVHPNVISLGSTSFFTDVSSEMVSAILPVYLVLALGLSPLQFGLIDGVYQGAAALAGLAGGWLADRLHRQRALAAAGYGLSALCKLGLLAVGPAWGAVAGVTALDRLGKGLRTAPRDALIAASSDPRDLGWSFGVHRALDTAGALLGPLVAFAILAQVQGGYDVVFVCSFFVAVIGLAVLLLFVRAPAPRAPGPVPAGAHAATREGLSALWHNRPFRAMLLIGVALEAVTVPDSFFYLTIQRRTLLPADFFPLLPMAGAVGFLLFAMPAGRLGDEIGRAKVFLLGHLLLLGAIVALLVGPAQAGAPGWIALALLGLHYACTDGVLMAAAAQWLPERWRATGFGLIVTGLALARMSASMSFGVAWDLFGLETALLGFALALVVALGFAARRWRLLEGRP